MLKMIHRDGSGIDPAVVILARQYLQLVDPDQLFIPEHETIRRPEIQAQIFESMFQEGCVLYPPPDRYKIRFLKKLVDSMEQAITDPEEDVCFPYFLLPTSLSS